MPQQHGLLSTEVVHHRRNIVAVRDQPERSTNVSTSRSAAVVDRHDRDLAPAALHDVFGHDGEREMVGRDAMGREHQPITGSPSADGEPAPATGTCTRS